MDGHGLVVWREVSSAFLSDIGSRRTAARITINWLPARHGRDDATTNKDTRRALAEEWEHTFHPSMSTFQNPLQSISLFVLLDLLGAPNPTIPSYFLTTHWAYKNLAALESRMHSLSILEASHKKPFLPDTSKPAAHFGRGTMQDDHIPFMRRGVDILHLIPNPFPDVWHHMEDDGEHLDMATVKDWAKIVLAFTVEWMGIKDDMPKKVARGEKRSETQEVMSRKTEL